MMTFRSRSHPSTPGPWRRVAARLAAALILLCGTRAQASGSDAGAARCDEPCSAESTSQGLRCCTEVAVHGSGAPIAWLRRGAPIPTPNYQSQGTGLVVEDLKRWLTVHGAVAGLAPMADLAPLEGLTPWARAPLRFGNLEVIRAAQTYRGVAVWGSGETVSLTVSPGQGIIAVDGAIADARETYAGWEAPIGEAAALAAAASYLAKLAQPGELSDGEPRYTAANAELVAIVELKAMAYAIEIVERSAVTEEGLGHRSALTEEIGSKAPQKRENSPTTRKKVGSLALRADTGLVVYLDFDFKTSEPEPEQHQQRLDGEPDLKVMVRTLESQLSDPFALTDAEKNPAAVRDAVLGEKLGGAIYMPLACQDDPMASPQCGEPRLGGPELVVIDAQGHEPEEHSAPFVVPTDPAGEFLAQPPASSMDPYTPETRAAGLQDAFYLLTATARLFAPFKEGRWDSLWRTNSGFAPEEFIPRLVFFFDTPPCQPGTIGCARPYFPRMVVEDVEESRYTYVEHAWTGIPPHRPPEGPDEGLGAIELQTESFRSIGLLFHEYGHFLDLFTAADFIGRDVLGSGCVKVDNKTTCTPACAPDTPDESPALAETFADLIAAYTIARLYPSVTYTSHCGALSQIAAGEVFTPVHDPGCVSDPSQIRSFLQERPAAPGFRPTADGPVPTGRCNRGPGYRQRALLTAWWEWIHGRSCAATAPFACEPFGDEDYGATTGIEALLYALSLTNETYYKKFLTDAETYLSCTYGEALGARWREVWCHHGGLGCAALPSPCPVTCGDGVVQGEEACDLEDLSGETCGSQGFAGGELRCGPDCTLDTSECIPAGSTGEAPTTDGDSQTGGATGDSATSGATGGLSEPGGCACTAAGSKGRAGETAGLLTALFFLCWRRRRRPLDSREGAA